MDIDATTTRLPIPIVITIGSIDVMILLVGILGSMTSWYENLVTLPLVDWVLWGIWVTATFLSYLGLFVFYNHILALCTTSSWPTVSSRNFALTVAFLVTALLTLGWIVIFYYGQNIIMSLWLISILFIYKFTIFTYMWYIKPLAAIFIIPLLILYLYLFYALAHLATINNIPI